MKIILQLLCLFLLLTQQALSNNVQVSNVRLTGQNTNDDFTMVEFDISWENSWRYANGPANWDAAWVFVKYRIGVAGNWQHAWLNNSGHSICNNTAINNGLLMPSTPFHITNNPVMGIFLNRNATGTGSFACENVQLRWNYGANGVGDNATVDIRVFAIEMVYIPEGSFYVGTADASQNGFYSYPDHTSPYHITSEGAITVSASNAQLYYNGEGDQLGPIPAAYPKGFKAFYAMKYEISQQSYVDFLNTLHRTQQISRVTVALGGQYLPRHYAMTDTEGPFFRNGVACRNSIPPQPGQVEFFCDLNNNNVGSELGDGANIACNWISYADVAAYLDWASLRLMTEFELEKCGRGNATSLHNEFAWGNHIYYYHDGIINSGFPNEISADPLANVTSQFSNGPLRTGIFANSTSDRVRAGAGFYGCLDLSGNLYERGVNVGQPEGRAYTGQHGNGLLSADGNADAPAWPAPTTALGVFTRGGSFGAGTGYFQFILSSRNLAGSIFPGREKFYGGRGVRTAE